MPSEVSRDVGREVGAAVRWLIVGIALGVLPTYVLCTERAKKETASASSAAASAAANAAAASVYAAWSATPPVVCPAITMPTVLAVTGSGNGNANTPQRPTRVATAPAGGNEVDDSQMMMPMLNMMQGMMQDGTGTPGAAGSGMPDMSQMMKNLPKQ